MKENIAKKNVLLLSLIQFFNQINFYSVIIILYFTDITGSYMLGMSIFSITTISTAILEIPTGILSDKIGRKKTIVIGSICSIVSNTILLLAKNYNLLIIYALFSGLEKALFSGNNDAYVYDNLKLEAGENRYVGVIGKVKSMTYLASAISALVGGILLFIFSYKLVIAISIIPKIIQFLVSIRLEEIKKYNTNNNFIKNVKIPFKEVIKNPILMKKILADSIMKSINESCYQFRTNFYKMVWSEWALGIPRILSNIGACISNWIGERVISKMNRKNIFIISNSYSIFTNILGISLQNVLSPIIMVSNSLFQTEYIDAEIEQKLYKDEYRASMGSIKSLFENCIFSIFSIFLGILADNFSVIIAFIIFQLLRIIPLVMTVKIVKKMEKNSYF